MKEFPILYFVWEGLGAGLRGLSLSGSAGNILALVLYVLISLLPVLVPGFGIWKRKRGLHGADGLLLVLSAYTFYLLYVFINPGLLSRRMPVGLGLGGELSVSYLKAVYGGLWLSLLVSWLLLTWIRSLNCQEVLDRKAFLYRGMRLLLTVTIVIFLIAFLYSAGTELTVRLTALRENAAGTGADIAFAFLRMAVTLIPSAFFLAILYQIKRLLKAMDQEPFREGEVREAKRLSRISRSGVTASVFSNLIWNSALFFWAGSLTSVDYHWEISLFPLLAAFGALILARYLREAGELRRDNEMII